MKFIPLLSVFLLTVGCASHFDAPASSLAPSEAELNVPPKQAVELIRKVVTSAPMNGSIQSDAHGVVTTGYFPYPGDWHIVRQWKEQTQFRVTVVPDWDEPTQKCRIQVTEQTQTRATDNQTWSDAPELNRKQRSQEFLQKIVAAAKAG